MAAASQTLVRPAAAIVDFKVEKVVVPTHLVVSGYRCFASALKLAASIEKVMGGAKPVRLHVGDEPNGADALALAYAKDKKWGFTVYCADMKNSGKPHHLIVSSWGKSGHAAGPIHNQAMLEAAVKAAGSPLNVRLVAFMHQASRGTRDCIGKAQKLKIPVTVVPVGNPDCHGSSQR